MSKEIKLTETPIKEGISELQSSIRTLDLSFSEIIEGDNKLEMVTVFNEIIEDYETLLTQFEALFLSNIDATNEAVEKLKETDRHIAQGIRLAK